MTPKTEEQNKKIRESKSELIRESALELFATKGIDSTSMSMIAKHARVSKGLIYNYFESKDDLLGAIVDDAFKEIVSVYDTIEGGINSKKEFIELLERYFEVMERRQNHWRMIMMLSFNPSAESVYAEKFVAKIIPFFKKIEEYFKIIGSDDPVGDTLFFDTIFDGIIISYLFKRDYMPFEVIKKKLYELYG